MLWVVPVPPGTAGFLSAVSELGMLSGSLRDVQASSHGHVMLVSGEAGVGKTSLLRAFSSDLGASVPVLWGTCDPLFAPAPSGRC